MRFASLLCAVLFPLCAAAAESRDAPRPPDVIYVPTPQDVVEDMLRLADVRKGDVLYDLGSGDGRIPVTAAKKYGVRAIGIDIDPDRIKEAKANARRNRVARLVQFRQQDLFETSFREATVVTLYLLPDLNLKLRPRLLAQLRPGARVVSHQFDMGDWKPDKTLETNGRTVYLWLIPEREAAIDTCLNNVLYFGPEVHDEAHRKPRGTATPTRSSAGTAQGRPAAG